MSLAVDHLAVLRDGNEDASAAFGVDWLDSLQHRVGIFPAVLHGLEAGQSRPCAGLAGACPASSPQNLWVSFKSRAHTLSR
jgi:hypothetical protein